MKWQDALFNDDGEDLIYETPGDAERGNPLDIVAVVTVNGGTDILGTKFPRKPLAKELARRWNAHAELLAACQAMFAALWVDYGNAVRNGYFPGMQPILKQGADAIEKATGVRPADTEPYSKGA